MSECKHEFIRVPLNVNGELIGYIPTCKNCLMTQNEINMDSTVDVVRRQLAAEQANSAEWELKFENMEQCMFNMTIWKNQEKDRAKQAEATIAVMREILTDFIAATPTNFPHAVIIDEWIIARDKILKAISNTAGAEYSRVKKLEEAARRLIDESKRIWLINQEDGIEIPHLKVAIDNLQAVLVEGKP